MSAIVTAGIIVILFSMLVIYLGVYGYANPDPEHCYYVDGVDQPATTRDAAEKLANDKGVEIKHGYPVDMAHLFRSWFLWGFWSHIIFLILHLVFVPMFFLCRETFAFQQIIYLILFGVSCCNHVAWFLMGFFWRFSRAGRIVSAEKITRGDLNDQDWDKKLEDARAADGYQLKGGRFISVFVWLILGGLFISIAIGSIVAVLMCMDTSGQQEYEKLMREQQDFEQQQ